MSTLSEGREEQYVTMNIRDWNPDDGDAYQGDIILFRIPDSIRINTNAEIHPRDGRLTIAEGELTGHHHAITLFREDGSGGGLATISRAESDAMLASALAPTPGTARLYRDDGAIEKLIKRGELTTAVLAIGILVVDGSPVILSHDEHDAIRIPVGRYYVGGQQEFDAGAMRRVAD